MNLIIPADRFDGNDAVVVKDSILKADRKIHQYAIASLHVESFMPLPAVPKSFPVADLVIKKGAVPDSLENRIADGGWWQIDREHTLLVRNVCSAKMMLRKGSEIIVQTNREELDEVDFSFLIGPVVSAAAVQQSILPFHASVVAFGDRCAMLIGERGAGKSTLAALFRTLGFPNMGDDLCAVSIKGNKARIAPTFPWIKLRPEAAVFLKEQSDLVVPSEYHRERSTILPDPMLGPKPRTLGAIFILTSSERPASAPGYLEPLGRVEAFQYLYRNIHASYFAKCIGEMDALFRKCLVVNRVPAFKCYRTRDLKQKPRQIDEIVNRMKSLA